MEKKKKNIFFVVCHPDDESLWVGGVLNLLSNIPFLNVFVICLSGNDSNSPRIDEFNNAIRISGCNEGIILGNSLRQANHPLPPVEKTFLNGLSILGLETTDIDLLITHSPFGDEHMNPHHIQASRDLYKFSNLKDIPFGYFSCLPLNNSLLKPILRNNLIKGKYGILNFSKCEYSISHKLLKFIRFRKWRYPKFYTQWFIDIKKKQQMLNCYKSINIESHKKNYSFFNSPVESIYLFDYKGFSIFNLVKDTFNVPGSKDYFLNWHLAEIIKSKISKSIHKS